jgi:predicted membrane protein
METLHRTKCPYCGKKLNFFLAWTLKREGEYRCTACKGISNIIVEPFTRILAIVAVAASALLFIIFGLILNHITFWLVFSVAFLFFLFFLLSSFTIHLERPSVRRHRRAYRPESVNSEQLFDEKEQPHFDEESGFTKQMDSIILPESEKKNESDQTIQISPIEEPMKEEDSVKLKSSLPRHYRQKVNTAFQDETIRRQMQNPYGEYMKNDDKKEP